MNDALLREFTEIRALAVKADRQDVQARYQIAVHCQNVRVGDGNGGKYGEKAVIKLAQAIGWEKSSIYDYANVAKINAIRDTADTFGQDLFKQIETADPSEIGDPLLEPLREAREKLNRLLADLDKFILLAEERRMTAAHPQDDWEHTTDDQDESA